MKSGIRLTLIPYIISGLILITGLTATVTAQPELLNIETTVLEYTAGAGQVNVTSSIQVEARFYIYSATIRISAGYNPAEDVLIYTGTYFNINSSWDKSTGTLTLTGFASDSRYRTALRSVKYENLNKVKPSTDIRTVSFTVNDGANSNTVTRNIRILVKDSPPAIGNIESDPAVFCMNSESINITQSLTLSDTDDEVLASATVTISTGYSANEDRLLFTNQNGITGTWNSNAGQLTLSGNASLSSYQLALRSVKYENTNPENPQTGYHDITFMVSDGILLSNTMSRTVIHSVPTAIISGNHSICSDESAAIQLVFTGSAPWKFSYRINTGSPVTVENVTAGTFILPANKEGTYNLVEVNDKYCPGKVSGSASVDIMPEPEVMITGLDPAYTRESTEMVPLTGLPAGGTFSGDGVIHYDDNWLFYPALLPVGMHEIVYQYRADEASCYGYDTASVRILEKSAAIEIAGDRVQFCKNDIPFTIKGINLLNNNPGIFSISGGKGLVNHGDNTATVYPDSLEANEYTLTYDVSGGIQATQLIEIGSPLTADFIWNAECFDESMPVFFTNTSSSPFGFLSSDSYKWTIYTETDSFSYATRDITHVFDEPANYVIKLDIRNSYGCVNKISRVFPLRPVFVLADNGYLEDFEGTQYWESGYNPDQGTNSWQLGKPNAIINGFSDPYSGEKCWFTNLNMNPVPREESWITSPCFDFTGTEKPTLVAQIRRSFTDNRDGVNFSYTTDNGLHWSPVGSINDGINWFNGYFSSQGLQSQGWTAITDNRWVETRHILDFLKGEPVVQFRFAFHASGSAIGNKGFAVDDIRIVERNRTILIEHFTNMSEEAAAADDILDEIAEISGSNVIDLQYHTSDPEDPFYSQNPVIPNTRQFYYGLSTVPYSVINGGYLGTQNIDYVNRILSPGQIAIESLYDSQFDLKVTSMRDGNRIYAEALLTSLSEVPLTELSVRMAVIEPLIINSTAAGEDSVFRNVVRAMIPDAAGTSIYRPWQKGESFRVVEWWDINNVFNPDALRIVAFIQNEQTHVVHQAAMDEKGLVNETINPSERQGFEIFPNPSEDFLNIRFFEENTESYNIELFNNIGETVYRQEARGVSVFTIPVRYLTEGMYLLRVTATNGVPQTRKIIINH